MPDSYRNLCFLSLPPRCYLDSSSLPPRIPRTNRGGSEEAMRRIRGGNEEAMRRSRGKKSIRHRITPIRHTLVRSSSQLLQNSEEKMSFVTGFFDARHSEWATPSHFLKIRRVLIVDLFYRSLIREFAQDPGSANPEAFSPTATDEVNNFQLVFRD